MSKEKILKEIKDVVDAVQEAPDEVEKAPEGIEIPVPIVKALLENVSGCNWTAVDSIVQQVREAAQDQAPARFPR